MNVLDWSFRENMGALKGAPLSVLINLLLHSNTNLRAWVGQETIAKETDYNASTVVEALKTLKDLKAIACVDYDKRIGQQEKALPVKKAIYQLTGFIMPAGEGATPFPYIAFGLLTEEAQESLQTNLLAQSFDCWKIQQSIVGKSNNWKTQHKGSTGKDSKDSTSKQGKDKKDSPNGASPELPDELELPEPDITPAIKGATTRLINALKKQHSDKDAPAIWQLALTEQERVITQTLAHLTKDPEAWGGKYQKAISVQAELQTRDPAKPKGAGRGESKAREGYHDMVAAIKTAYFPAGGIVNTMHGKIGKQANSLLDAKVFLPEEVRHIKHFADEKVAWTNQPSPIHKLAESATGWLNAGKPRRPLDPAAMTLEERVKANLEHPDALRFPGLLDADAPKVDPLEMLRQTIPKELRGKGVFASLDFGDNHGTAT